MHTHTDHQTLWHLIKHIKFGMLTHRHSNGELHSHPLTTQNKSADEDSQLYFFISRYRNGPAVTTGSQRQYVLCRPRQ